MDLAPPPLDPAAAPGPVPDPPPAKSAAPPDRVIGGVAALLAARLGVDALWLRIGFVVLALVGGIGLLVYLALWLALVRGADRPWARIAGGALLVVGLPILLADGSDRFLDGWWAVLALLTGLALALWQHPRRAAAPAPFAAPPLAPPPDPSPATAVTPPPAPEPPSLLGRLTLGVAALGAAVGALIDQANGGRLHPEQWLGAAAIVCGVGLIVGTVVGRARWLVIPAALFAGVGLVAGETARVGLHDPALVDTQTVYVGPGMDVRSTIREHVVLGDVEVNIGGPPPEPVVVDARTAVGDVRIHVADDVTVEVRTRRGYGDVRVDGVTRPAGTFTVGPEGRPDVVVVAIVGHGDIDVDRLVRGAVDIGAPVIRPIPPVRPAPPAGQVDEVADGVAVTSDGSIVLSDGEALIDADDRVVVGDYHQEDRVTVITTSSGEFRLLPGALLLTPFGELLDLNALRGGTSAAPTTTAPTTTTTAGG